MTILPVIVRELRAQARQKFTFSLREAGVLAMLVAGVWFALGNPLVARSGGELFAHFHRTLFLAIWILVPFSAADCLSRERREGTLGLLFLTPLKPVDIVIAKGLAHGLRALTLLVAVLPVMTIPMLLGGLSWQQALLSTLINFSAICWALAVSLVASAMNRLGLRAVVTAVTLGLGALLLFAVSLSLLVSGSPAPMPGGRFVTDESWLQGLAIAGLSPRHWMELLTVLPARQVIAGVAQSTVLAVLMFALAASLAARSIRSNWREEPPPVWWQKTRSFFCTPRFWLSFFHWWMKRKLNHNPVGWLEQRTWTGRLVTWSWFAVVVSLYSLALTDPNFFRNFHSFQMLVAWLMIGSIAASAAGSFRRERETGVLELLLVAPLTTNQIIAGRLRGLWGQFLPSMSLLLGVWWYLAGYFRRAGAEGVAFLAIAFLTLPVIGLYFSVRCRSFVAAFLLTLGCGLLVPMMGEWVIELVWTYAIAPGVSAKRLRPVSGASLAQLALALYFALKLRWRLETRSFPLERMVL